MNYFKVCTCVKEKVNGSVCEAWIIQNPIQAHYFGTRQAAFGLVLKSWKLWEKKPGMRGGGRRGPSLSSQREFQHLPVLTPETRQEAWENSSHGPSPLDESMLTIPHLNGTLVKVQLDSGSATIFAHPSVLYPIWNPHGHMFMGMWNQSLPQSDPGQTLAPHPGTGNTKFSPPWPP